jgi:hypothetical protein
MVFLIIVFFLLISVIAYNRVQAKWLGYHGILGASTIAGYKSAVNTCEGEKENELQICSHLHHKLQYINGL